MGHKDDLMDWNICPMRRAPVQPGEKGAHGGGGMFPVFMNTWRGEKKKTQRLFSWVPIERKRGPPLDITLLNSLQWDCTFILHSDYNSTSTEAAQ